MRIIGALLTIVAWIAAVISGFEMLMFLSSSEEISAPQQAGEMAQVLAQAAIPYFIARLWNDLTGIEYFKEIKDILKQMANKQL
jgi:hypothetical protein